MRRTDRWVHSASSHAASGSDVWQLPSDKTEDEDHQSEDGSILSDDDSGQSEENLSEWSQASCFCCCCKEL